MIKHEQSKEPIVGIDPTHETVYKVAVFCQKCRWHVELLVDFRDDGAKTTPCHQSSKDNPLHHFVFEAEDTESMDKYGNRLVPRVFRYQCSAPRCPVSLHIRMRPPRITERYFTTMTSTTGLKQRLENAKKIAGERADQNVARPVDALDFLSTYLSDCLKPQKGKSRIPLMNRKFLKTFGQDCDEILQDMGFTHEVEKNDEDEDVPVWHLPRPPPPGDPLDEDTQRTIIEDAQYELTTLLFKFKEVDRIGIRNAMIQPQPAIQIIERVMGCEEYPKKPLSGTRSSNSEEDHPYYAGLGSIGDFTDSLLIFAFIAQYRVDPSNASYYYECLQSIAIGRNSEDLNTEVMMLASKGHTTRQEVNNAYRYFSIDPQHASSISDENVLAVFRSRLPDIGPGQVEEARNTLRIIGNARNSDKIRQEASNAIETYEQASDWLGLGKDTPDDFVPTMVEMKLQEKNTDRDTVMKAVKIIAEARDSLYLREYAETGRLPEASIDAGEAYATLGIADRTQAYDVDMLRMQVDMSIAEKPVDREKLEKAFEVVCKDQRENPRTGGNGVAANDEKCYPLESWPVGCINIGNTCYLNSVLQYLFTIKRLRDMVLDCDKYLQEKTPAALEKKRVGRSAVTVEKVERAQQFVYELRKLFRRMINANERSIRPDLKLATLALSKDGVTYQDAPDHQNHDSGLGSLNGMAVIGPMPNPTASSEPSGELEETKVASATDSVMGDDGGARSETSSTVAEFDADEDHPMTSSVTANDISVDRPPQPTRPPPIPPRPQQQQQYQHQDLKKIEGWAQQQDAAEILNNIFDLLSCAIKPEDKFPDGEQYDVVKDLFFSEITTVRDTNGKVSTNSALQDNHLISPGSRDRSLYAALDDEFSLTELESEGKEDQSVSTSKYEYINRASPIQIINVRRLIFEGGRSKKDESHVGLEEVLYLDRYLRATDRLSEERLLELRQKQWDTQRKIRELKVRKQEVDETALGMNLTEVVAETANLIEDLAKVEDDKLIDLEQDPIPANAELASQLRDRVKDLDFEIKMLEGHMTDLEEEASKVFDSCKDHPYRLHAVFMHRGNSASGHYWIYIYDFQNQIWREYNDERIREVEDPLKAIYEKEGKGYHGTSTGVVYVREDLIYKYTEAVNRQPKPDDDTDVEMKEVEPETNFEEVQVINGVAVSP